MILLVMILAVSAVSAADIDDSSDADILAVDDAVEEVAAVDDVDEIQQSTDTEEVVADGEPGNFSDLQFDIRDPITGITIYKDYVRSEGDNEITIDHDVSIDGKGIYTIDGNNKGAIFKVNAGKTLTLKGLTIKNGHASDGGAISNYGTLIIENCKFIDNKADRYGGAIFTENCGDITIYDSEFINNQAEDAGVIKFKGQNLVITNTKFENNNASKANGVIDFWSDNGNLTIEKSVFNNNSAAYYGAVDFRYGRTCTIANTNFTNNQAFDTEEGASGALYFIDAYNLIITDSNFIDNAAAVAYGAIFFNGLYMSVEGSNFTNNTAYYYGAIFAYKHKDVPTTVDIKDSKFESNGNIAIGLNNVKSEISKTEFIGNQADNNGSAILIDSGEAKITESKFENNSHVAVSNKGILSVSNNTFDSQTGIVSVTPVIKPGSKVTIDPIANVTYGSPVVITYRIDNQTDFVTISVIDVNDPDKLIYINTTVDNKITVVDVLPVGTYKVSINNPESDNYAESDANVTFYVVKAPSKVTIDPVDNVTYGSPVVITYNIDNETDFVTISVKDVYNSDKQIEIDTTVDNKITVVDVLPAGKYIVSVDNPESDMYIGSEANVTFYVIAPSKVTIEPVANVTYGSPVVVNYAIENRSTNVTVSICNASGMQPEVPGVNYTMTNDTITIYDLNVGNYLIKIFNEEDYKTYLSFESILFNVTKAQSKITVDPVADVTYGSPVVIKYIIENETEGASIYVHNVNGTDVIDRTDSNGTITISDILPVGTYMVEIYNPDTDNVFGSNVNITFNVVKAPSKITIEANNVIYGNPVVIKYSIENETEGASIFVHNINSEDPIDKNVSNDTITISDILPIGTYIVEIFNPESDCYLNSTEQATFEVKLDSNLTITSSVNEYGILTSTVTVDKNATGNVTFIVRNAVGEVVVNSTEEIVNGTASFGELTQYDKGAYTLEVIYSGDSQFLPVTQKSADPVNITKNYVKYNETVDVSGNQAKITMHFPAGATGNITIFFPSGVNQSVAINSTVVIDEIFDNGEQHVLVIYPGDDNYYGFYEYNIDFLVKATSFISAKGISVVYQNNGKVTVTLTDNNDGKGNNPVAGATVTVTVNGKKYTGVTNAKGIATISIPAKLVPKTYKATVSYAGTATCVGDSATFNFKVTKAKPKITAKKKTFKAKKKSKKYTITLKDNKGKAIKKVKVYIKVKGKTYSAKTNKKGKATFNLKKLKKRGTHKAKITYKGNKYFSKVTKTVKIKVKK